MELQEGCVKDAKDRETRTKTVRYEGTLDTHIHTAAAAFKWVSTNQRNKARMEAVAAAESKSLCFVPQPAGTSTYQILPRLVFVC